MLPTKPESRAKAAVHAGASLLLAYGQHLSQSVLDLVGVLPEPLATQARSALLLTFSVQTAGASAAVGYYAARWAAACGRAILSALGAVAGVGGGRGWPVTVRVFAEDPVFDAVLDYVSQEGRVPVDTLIATTMLRGPGPPVGGFGPTSADDDDAGPFCLRVPRVHLLPELPESQHDGASFMWSPGECGVSPEMGPGVDAKAPTGTTSASGRRILVSKPVRISVVRMRESDSRGFGGGAPAPRGGGDCKGLQLKVFVPVPLRDSLAGIFRRFAFLLGWNRRRGSRAAPLSPGESARGEGKRLLKVFIETALKRQLEQAAARGKVSIYTSRGPGGGFGHGAGGWSISLVKNMRRLDSVILDGNIACNVLRDMQYFFSERQVEWYRKMGIAHRRGYLLYGPPGCGKTSLAQVLAGELGLDMCIINLAKPGLNDEGLLEQLRFAPRRAMLLLEDVDAIFVRRTQGREGGTDQGTEDGRSRGSLGGSGGGFGFGAEHGGGRARSDVGVSFSGLLNALDGVAAQEGRVVVMTTNYKDRY